MLSTSLQNTLSMSLPHDRELAQLKRLSHWLDSRFRLPGTQFRFGLDSILGLIPGVGDTVGAAFTLYLLRKSSQYGLPWRTRLRMLWNLFIDWLVGLIPLVGDLFDAGWKANHKNLNLLLAHLQKNDTLPHETHSMRTIS